MNIHYRTQGFIFKKVDTGEADRLFIFFTKDFGRTEILAKAERKIQSKLRSGLEVFNLVDLEFIQGKTHKTLTDVFLIDNFKNIKKDLGRLRVAYQISEALDYLVKDQQEDEGIWSLILEVFKKLNNHLIFATNYFLIRYFFIWNLFSLLGYRPEIYHCSVCEKKLESEKFYFSFQYGGTICRLCYRRNRKEKTVIVNDNLIKILRIILKKDWKTLEKLKFEKIQEKLLKDVSSDYLFSIIDQKDY